MSFSDYILIKTLRTPPEKNVLKLRQRMYSRCGSNEMNSKILNVAVKSSPSGPWIRLSSRRRSRFRMRMHQGQQRCQTLVVAGELLHSHTESVPQIAQFSLKSLDLCLLGSLLAVYASAQFCRLNMTQKVEVQMHCDASIWR